MEEKSLLNENNLEIFEGDIKKLIYTIRGKQVILDSDVAMLYHYETKKINQTVKRNIERFPEDFCFQLNESEVNNNWSQFVTSSNKDNNKHRGKKYLPYAFTEQGIAMLSGLLRSEIAKTNSFHDRFIVIDNSQIYHCGASLKDAGKKCFAINKMEDKFFLEKVN